MDSYENLSGNSKYIRNLTEISSTLRECLMLLYCSDICPTRCNYTQFILSGNCSTWFEWYLRPSSGAHTTVSTASGICHTVTVICRYRGSWNWLECAVGGVRHPTQTGFNFSTIAADSNNGVTNTRCCRYSCMRFWWWAGIPLETCRAVSR
jgi:hypothetical protein